MNTKNLVALIALISLLPFSSQAKSPWDKAPAESEMAPEATTTTEPQMVEPLEPQAIAAEDEMVEPVAAEPIAPAQPVAAEPIAPAEPVAASEAPADSIEVIETTGDVLAMPQPTQNEIDASPMLLLDFPRRGMDQNKVQSELGTPVEIKDAVGQPPITRWIYSDRVVYFERTTVLHVVAR